MRCAVRSGGFMGLLLLGACTTPAPAPAPVPEPIPTPVAAPPPAPAKMSVADADRLDALLEKGDRALKDNRLLTPIDNCAYDFYRDALKVAPGHPAALHGLQRIAERYVAMAEQSAEKGQYAVARKWLDHARLVDPDLDSIANAETQIQVRSTAQRDHTSLDAEQLTSRSPALSSVLKTLGAKAKARDAWVVIRARNDAEGRWIYQQMADSPGDRRIRAELTLASPPGVDLLQLNAEADKETE